MISVSIVSMPLSTAAVPIPQTPDYVDLLNSVVHSQQVLVSAGYTVKKLSKEELESKKRCAGCGKRMLCLNDNKGLADS